MTAVALGGCGGSNDDTGTPAKESTARGEEPSSNTARGENGGSETAASGGDFVEQADAICIRSRRHGYHAMVRYLERTKNSSKPESQRITEAIQVGYLPDVEKTIKEIRTLNPPESEGWQVKAFIVALKEGIYSGNRATANLQLDVAFKHSAELARTLGIKGCIFTFEE